MRRARGRRRPAGLRRPGLGRAEQPGRRRTDRPPPRRLARIRSTGRPPTPRLDRARLATATGSTRERVQARGRTEGRRSSARQGGQQRVRRDRPRSPIAWGGCRTPHPRRVDDRSLRFDDRADRCEPGLRDGSRNRRDGDIRPRGAERRRAERTREPRRGARPSARGVRFDRRYRRPALVVGRSDPFRTAFEHR